MDYRGVIERKTNWQFKSFPWSDNLFKETLRYSSPSRPGSVSPRYDVTLSETTVQHALSSGVTQSETWGYSYDKLSRLTDALHFNGSSTSSSNINTERDITYDFNGNITALKRYGPSGLANNLTFMLTGNRMSAVSDLTLLGTQFAGILMYLKTVDIISNQENTILIGASNKQYEGYSALAYFYSNDYYSLAFGTATIYMNKKNRIVGFYDNYNFNSKPNMVTRISKLFVHSFLV